MKQHKYFSPSHAEKNNSVWLNSDCVEKKFAVFLENTTVELRKMKCVKPVKAYVYVHRYLMFFQCVKEQQRTKCNIHFLFNQ
jgi:hypothetical protein